MLFFLRRALLVSFALVLAGAPAFAQPRRADALEQRVRNVVAERLARDALPFLERTVNVNSGTRNREGVIAMAALYEPRFVRLGFDVRRIDLARVARGCHLVAERKGKAAGSRTRVLLLGHLDTVFEKDSGFLQYRATADGKLTGPGVSDMKGGNVVILEALEALHAVGTLDDLDVAVMLTGDEEDPGTDSDGSFTTTRAPLVELASRADAVLAFEPMNATSPRPIVARRGYAQWRVEVDAKSAHSSLAFTRAVGPGAIVPLARIVDRFQQELRTEKQLGFNVGNAAAGTAVEREPGREESTARASGKLNIVPSRAEAYGDLRATSAAQLGRAREAMQRVVDAELAKINRDYDSAAHVRARVVVKDEYPAMAPSPGNARLLALYSETSQDLGGPRFEGADVLTQGAGDVSFAAAHAPASLDGLGVVGTDYHTARESTDVTSLRAAIERAAVLMARLRARKAQ